MTAPVRGGGRPAGRRRRGRAVVAGVVVAGAALVGGWLVPGTSGAFTAAVTDTQNTVRTATTFTCADRFAAPTANGNAYFEWRLDEAATATTAADSSAAANAGLYQNGHGVDAASPMACPNDTPLSAATFDGTSQYVVTSNAVGSSPGPFSLVVWFKTTVKGGRLLGLSSAQTSVTSTYDRHVYLNSNGQLMFGTYRGQYQIVTTPTGKDYADGTWHQVVATMNGTAPNQGMYLYADGVLRVSNANYTAAEADTGYWRVGYYPLYSSWNEGSTNNFTGSIRFAAAYKYVLTAGEVAAAWSIGKPS